MIHLHNPQLNFEEHPEDYQTFKTQKGLMSFDDAWLERQPEEQRLGIFAKELRYKKNITIQDLLRRRWSEYEKYNAFEAGTQSPSYVELYKWTVKLNANQEEKEKMLRLRAYSITPEEYEAVKRAFKKYEGYLSFDHEPDNWLSKQPEKEQFWIYAKELRDYIGYRHKSNDAVNGLMSLFRWEKHGVLALEKIDECARLLERGFSHTYTWRFNAEKFKALASLVIAPEPVFRPLKPQKTIPIVSGLSADATENRDSVLVASPIVPPETDTRDNLKAADATETSDSKKERPAESREKQESRLRNYMKQGGRELLSLQPEENRIGLYVKAGRIFCSKRLEKDMAVALNMLLQDNINILLGGGVRRDVSAGIEAGIKLAYNQEEKESYETQPKVFLVTEDDIKAYETGAAKIPLHIAIAYAKYFQDKIFSKFDGPLFSDCLKTSNAAIDARTKDLLPLSAEMVGTMPTTPEAVIAKT